jgi:hypothetical protein
MGSRISHTKSAIRRRISAVAVTVLTISAATTSLAVFGLATAGWLGSAGDRPQGGARPRRRRPRGHASAAGALRSAPIRSLGSCHVMPNVHWTVIWGPQASPGRPPLWTPPAPTHGGDDQAATACSSVLASAFDSNCGPATTIYGLSLMDTSGGIVLVIIEIVLRTARHSARPGPANSAVAPS